MIRDNTLDAFFALVRAGLWERKINLSTFDGFDYEKLLQLAEEQSVVGLVTAGMEHVTDVKVPQVDLLQYIGQSLQLEQQNTEMNRFIGDLVERMRKVGIYALLVKGQGIAQCYEKPMWRASGDVDFLLSSDNYVKAKDFLQPLSSTEEMEGEYQKHYSMTIDSWVVELHGTLRSGLSHRVDKMIDDTQRDVFYGGNVRSWMNNGAQVFLPGSDCDVIFIFTHFLKHFYKGGLGLRQICDWCRLLYTYKESLNHGLLESRIKKAGLMSEWKAFGAFSVKYLGMPAEVMPLYDSADKWKRKADRICSFIMEVGNFGHNRDRRLYENKPYVIRKILSMARRVGDLLIHSRIFPLDSIRFLPYIIFNGISSAVRGE